MRLSTPAIAGVVSLFVAAGVQAGPGSFVMEQIFADDAGNALPGNLVTVRVYWQADAAGDQLVGIVGSPSNPMNISVSGGTFFDSGNFAAGDRPPSVGFLGLPGFEELSYDSWFTIGNTSLDLGPAWPSGSPFEDEVITAPGTAFDAGGLDKWSGGSGGPDNVAWTVPPTQDDPGGGGVQATPQSVAGNWAGNRIAVMQLTVTPNPGPGGVTIEGTFGALTVVGGNSTETQGNFTNFPPTPGTLAVLGLAALGCRRRRV